MKITKTQLQQIIAEELAEAFRDRDFPSMTDKRSRAQMRADSGVRIPDSLSDEPEVATSIAHAMGSEEPDLPDPDISLPIESDLERMKKNPKIAAAYKALEEEPWNPDYYHPTELFTDLLTRGEISIALKGSGYEYAMSILMALNSGGFKRGVDFSKEHKTHKNFRTLKLKWHKPTYKYKMSDSNL